MKVLMLFADGFEDVEAIATRDVLVRAGIEVTNAKINEYNQIVISSHKLSLTGFLNVKYLKSHEYDALIIPGGSRGVNNLLASEEVNRLVKAFNDEHKYICAICAGPMVLSKAGVLKDKRFTCYPGCEEGLEGIYTGEEVVKDDKIITARSMLYSIPFGLEIIGTLLGKETRDRIYRQIAGLK